MSSVLISRNGGAQTRIGGTQAAKESFGVFLHFQFSVYNNKRLQIERICCIIFSDKAEMLFWTGRKVFGPPMGGDLPRHFFDYKGNPLKSDKTLNILIDESGDFGKFDSKDHNYHVLSFFSVILGFSTFLKEKFTKWEL